MEAHTTYATMHMHEWSTECAPLSTAHKSRRNVHCSGLREEWAGGKCARQVRTWEAVLLGDGSLLGVVWPRLLPGDNVHLRCKQAV
jgi:hypothetical protein